MSQESKASGPQNKLLMTGLVVVALVSFIAIAFVFFGPIGLFIGGVVAIVAALGYLALFWMRQRPKPLVDLEQASYMDILECTFMANLPTPSPLKTSTEENSTVMCHPGDIFGRTKLPVDNDYYDLIGEKAKLDDGQPNTVWAYRMRMLHKAWGIFSKKDQYIAIVCQSQLSKQCLDATGDIQFNSIVYALGHWARYGPFYILFNQSKHLATSQAAIDTVKAIVALKMSQNRLTEAVEANAKTQHDVVTRREAGKDIIEVIKQG